MKKGPMTELIEENILRISSKRKVQKYDNNYLTIHKKQFEKFVSNNYIDKGVKSFIQIEHIKDNQKKRLIYKYDLNEFLFKYERMADKAKGKSAKFKIPKTEIEETEIFYSKNSRLANGKKAEIKYMENNKKTNKNYSYIWKTEENIKKDIPILIDLIKLIISKFPEYNLNQNKIIGADIIEVKNMKLAIKEIENLINKIKNQKKLNILDFIVSFKNINFIQIKDVKIGKETIVTESFYKELFKSINNVNKINFKQCGKYNQFVIYNNALKTDFREFRRSRETDTTSFETNIKIPVTINGKNRNKNFIIGKSNPKTLKTLFPHIKINKINNFNVTAKEKAKKSFDKTMTFIQKIDTDSDIKKLKILLSSQYLFFKHKIVLL